jgi:peptide subunit release factor 1 (eRF1)
MRLDPAHLPIIKSLRGVSDTRGVLSVYLPIEPGRGITHGHAPRLMDLLKPVSDSAHGDAKHRVEEEAQRVLAYVRDEYTPHGATLAVFSSTPAGVWAAIELELEVPGLARFGPQPYLAPIDALLEDYPTAIAVVADHNEARIITIKLGEFAGSSRLTGDAPGRQRQGGWSAFRYERDRVRHIETFNKQIVDTLAHLERRAPFQYLVLGGTDETTHALASALTPELHPRLAGTFRVEMFATDAEVVDKTKPLIDAAERAQERDLVQSLIDTALAGGQAALGVDETLQTLREGRAHQLVVAAGTYNSPNGDLAVQLAEQTDAPVEIAHDEAEVLLQPYGGLAAKLRY